MNVELNDIKKPLYSVKDLDGDDVGQTDEPDTHAAVLKEIKAIGADTKKNYEEMRTEHEALKKELDASGEKMDVIAQAKFDKLSEALITRQSEVDKKFTGRMDEVEVAIKRALKKGVRPDDDKEVQQAIEFKNRALILKNQLSLENKVTVDNVDLMEYQGYKKMFDTYLRRYDGRQDLTHIVPDFHKLMLVASDPDGGILVTPMVSDKVVKRIFETDPLRQLASIQTIGTDALVIMADLDELDVSWETETKATDETGTPQRQKIRIPVHVQSARPRATQSLLDDASINVEAWLAGKVAEKFGRVEAATFVNGDGVGKPRGFLTYPNWTTPGTFEFGKIEQINMGAADALTTDGFVDVMYSLVEDFLFRGTWLMNRLTVRETMKLKDGDGQYIWRVGLQPGQPSVILAVPLRMSTTMPLVAANALSVAIADWSQGYQIVDRQGITVQRDPFTVKPLVEFYTRRRVGADVINFQAIKIGKVAA